MRLAVISVRCNSYQGLWSISNWNCEHKIQMLHFHNTSDEIPNSLLMQQRYSSIWGFAF